MYSLVAGEREAGRGSNERRGRAEGGSSMANWSQVNNVNLRAPLAEELARHVTIWNRLECRKIAGNAAPLRRNLDRYLAKHPECEVYMGQDKLSGAVLSGAIDPKTGAVIMSQNEHVAIWHKAERRKVTGNAAPLRKNLVSYLQRHPECEEYMGQDKAPAEATPQGEQAANMHMGDVDTGSDMRAAMVDARMTQSSAENEDSEERAWNPNHIFSSSIPIPDQGFSADDMMAGSFRLGSTPLDLSGILNSPAVRSMEYDLPSFSGSADLSPSRYFLFSSPQNSQPKPHVR